MQGIGAGLVCHCFGVLLLACLTTSLIDNETVMGPPGLSYTREQLLAVRGVVGRGSVCKSTWSELINCQISAIKPNRRGLSVGQKRQTGSGQTGCLQTIISTFTCRPHLQGDRGSNPNNLVQVPIKRSIPRKAPRRLRVATVNAQSIRNKIDILHDLVIEHDIDILCITETWLTHKDCDEFYVSALKLIGYILWSVPRKNSGGHGGGVAFLYRSSLQVTSKIVDPVLETVENARIRFTVGGQCLDILLLYRPPPSALRPKTKRKWFYI